VSIDVVMAARDEETTVAANVTAARACRYVRSVVVVDDGSGDATAQRAAAAGAEVVRRHATIGSKALAMAAGVAATDADAILFVDADCTGLTAGHLDQICAPFVEGRSTMSIGFFDYGRFWNWVVLRCPPLSGERVVPRWVFEAVPATKLDGYTIEVRLNEVICEARLRISVRVMTGAQHRTKRAKVGRREGLRQTWRMYRSLVSLLVPIGDIRWRTYWFYLRGLTIER
jgi:glycosyltransferase involved in cell wall biosynthesis